MKRPGDRNQIDPEHPFGKGVIVLGTREDLLRFLQGDADPEVSIKESWARYRAKVCESPEYHHLVRDLVEDLRVFKLMLNPQGGMQLGDSTDSLNAAHQLTKSDAGRKLLIHLRGAFNEARLREYQPRNSDDIYSNPKATVTRFLAKLIKFIEDAESPPTPLELQNIQISLLKEEEFSAQDMSYYFPGIARRLNRFVRDFETIVQTKLDRAVPEAANGELRINLRRQLVEQWIPVFIDAVQKVLS